MPGAPLNKRRELASIVNRGTRGPRGANLPMGDSTQPVPRPRLSLTGPCAKRLCVRDDPWWTAGAGPVAQGHAFLYKGAKSRARDGQ
jgi:hypothetical protein